MIISLTFDVEQDCPPYLNSSVGMEKGLPAILDLLRENNVKATFFFSAKMALEHTDLVRRVIDEGHEVGCHAHAHECLPKLRKEEATVTIREALSALREFGDVVSFRAPNLLLPDHLFPALAENGVLVDSSKAWYKGHRGGAGYIDGILEIPVSITSSILRLPWLLQKPIHKYLREPRVYFAHPWEFVPMQKTGVRYDCRFNTGIGALQLLARLLHYYDKIGAETFLMRDHLGRFPESPK